MVHESGIIIARGCGEGESHLWVELVDSLDRTLDIARMDRRPDLYSCLNGVGIRLRLDIGLNGELVSRRGVPIRNEVVHHQVVDITETVSNSHWNHVDESC